MARVLCWESSAGWFCSFTALSQPVHFGRVYAAYGGWFVVLSIPWRWIIDSTAPDRFDTLDGVVCLAGIAIIMYWPR